MQIFFIRNGIVFPVAWPQSFNARLSMARTCLSWSPSKLPRSLIPLIWTGSLEWLHLSS